MTAKKQAWPLVARERERRNLSDLRDFSTEVFMFLVMVVAFAPTCPHIRQLVSSIETELEIDQAPRHERKWYKSQSYVLPQLRCLEYVDFLEEPLWTEGSMELVIPLMETYKEPAHLPSWR
jgi:hypothetical protein